MHLFISRCTFCTPTSLCTESMYVYMCFAFFLSHSNPIFSEIIGDGSDSIEVIIWDRWLGGFKKM
jgi:hypothetical protein